jgi:hypothetical protein
LTNATAGLCYSAMLIRPLFSALFFSTAAVLCTATAPPAAAAERETDPKEIVRFTGKLATWLTAEIAAKLAGHPADQAQVSYQPSKRFPIRDVIGYEWKGDRKKTTTGALKMELPVNDSVKAGYLRKSSLQELKDKQEMIQGETVAGLGDHAVWFARDQQLLVLSGEVEFSVWVNLSDDAAVNRAKSVELAKELIGKL